MSRIEEPGFFVQCNGYRAGNPGELIKI